MSSQEGNSRFAFIYTTFNSCVNDSRVMDQTTKFFFLLNTLIPYLLSLFRLLMELLDQL